jgi:hypothetical protein
MLLFVRLAEGSSAIARLPGQLGVSSMTAVDDELARRLHLWAQIKTSDLDDADPGRPRSLLVYGGAQGI